MFDAVQAHVLGISGAADLASESIEDQRHYHAYRQTMGWFMVVGFVLAIVGSLLLRTLLSFIVVFVGSGMLIKGVRMIGSGRRGLRELDTRLPRAQLVKR